MTRIGMAYVVTTFTVDLYYHGLCRHGLCSYDLHSYYIVMWLWPRQEGVEVAVRDDGHCRPTVPNQNAVTAAKSIGDNNSKVVNSNGVMTCSMY